MSLSKEILEGTKEGVNALLSGGAEVNILDEYGFTPLINAAIKNDPALVALLLKRNANVHMVDMTGSTALHWAVDNNSVEIAKLLIDHGANPNTYSSHGQPTLFYPLLRKHKSLITLLVTHGADMNYAKDFINVKLVGHRFELRGNTDVVTPDKLFLSIDLEGFYLEFTLDIIRESIERYINSYLAHRMDIHAPELNKIIRSFENASKLREYKHIHKDITANRDVIHKLIKIDLLLLPVSYKGHAITFIKHGGFLAKCDRGVHKMTDPIVINTLGMPEKLNEDFYVHLLYGRHSERYMKSQLYQILGLTPFAKLPIKHQVTGNCSWANVESSVPTMLYILLYDKLKDKKKAEPLIKEIMHFYKTWLEWDKDRALEDCMRDFAKIPFQRQKAIATLLGAVLFQACKPNNPYDVNRAKKILTILSQKPFRYVVKIYLNIFVRGRRTSQGQVFVTLLKQCGYQPSTFLS